MNALRCERIEKGRDSQDTCFIFIFLAKAPQKLRTKDK